MVHRGVQEWIECGGLWRGRICKGYSSVPAAVVCVPRGGRLHAAGLGAMRREGAHAKTCTIRITHCVCLWLSRKRTAGTFRGMLTIGICRVQATLQAPVQFSRMCGLWQPQVTASVGRGVGTA